MPHQHQQVVVTAFVTHHHKCLIIRRAPHETFLPGYYELPSGKVNFGEDLKTALQRETLEETRLQIQVLHTYHYLSYLIDNHTRHNVEIFFTTKLISNPKDTKLSPDHDDFQWITKDQLSNFKISDEIITAILKGFELT